MMNQSKAKKWYLELVNSNLKNSFKKMVEKYSEGVPIFQSQEVQSAQSCLWEIIKTVKYLRDQTFTSLSYKTNTMC